MRNLLNTQQTTASLLARRIEVGMELLLPSDTNAVVGIENIARDASNALIAVLGKILGHIVRLRKILPDLLAGDFKALSVVVDGEVVGGLDFFYQLGADTEIITPFSTFNGIEQWGYAWDFANVIGSTYDTLLVASTSWIALWKAAVENPFSTCTSTRFSSRVLSPPDGPVGGHIVRGSLARPVAQGSDEAHALPICRLHHATNTSYMGTLQKAWCVKLDNYSLWALRRKSVVDRGYSRECNACSHKPSSGHNDGYPP
jgi:hypothetical protein